MLVADVDLDLARRSQVPVLPQLLFAGCTMLVTLGSVLWIPETRTSATFWVGAAAVVLATLASTTLPWQRIGLEWLLVVP